jgi:hypothetical protein
MKNIPETQRARTNTAKRAASLKTCVGVSGAQHGRGRTRQRGKSAIEGLRSSAPAAL